MAKEENGVWRTVGGRRIFIKEGQDLATAMKESGKFNNNNNNNKKERFKNLNEYEKNKLYSKLSQSEKEEYDKLKKEIKEAYKNNDNVLANKLKEKRQGLLINKMEDVEEVKNVKKEDTNETKKDNNVKRQEITSEQIDKINDSIDHAIISYGEEGRVDVDKDYSRMLDEIYEDTRVTLNRELTDEDFEFIDGQLEAYYKDGFFVSKDSFSLKEYEHKMMYTMEDVDNKLSDLGFDVVVSRSIYAGLLPSRYYTKDGITIRIGDHTNSNNASPSHTRAQLYNSTPEDLVNYVKERYEERKKS